MARITVGVNEKGSRVGEDHQRATLTDHDVESMRQLREEGIGYKRSAKMFDTSVRNVRDIVNYKRRVSTPTAWKTVQGMATKSTPEKKIAFLAALAETGNVSRAAKAIDVARITVYEWRDEDEEFAAAREKANRIGMGSLADEVSR
ncbi:hypothetical protein OY671_008942, partial [Metschnikowia pulcherrima]